MTWLSLRARLAGIVMFAAAALVCSPAHAQPGRGGGFGGMGPEMLQPSVSTRDLERYARMLSLTDEQNEAAKALLEGFQAEYERAAKVMREATDAAREEFRETRDFTVWQDLRPKMEAFRDQRNKIESAFLSDVKSLLTDEQAAIWPRIERARRRDSTMRRGILSGEGVDLVRLSEEFKAEGPTAEAVRTLLDQYEAELDRALVERNEIYDSAMEQGMGMWRQGDMQGMQELMNKGREAGIKVRDINRKFARQLQALLPEEEGHKFEATFRERSFPRVYRQTYAARAMDVAGEFDDLTADQQTQLAEVRSTFEREVAAVNQKWAAAIEESEQTATVADMMGMGGGNESVRAARNARRDLENRALERLKALLTPDQASRLPDRRGRDEDDEGNQRRGPGGGEGGRGRDGGDR